LLTPIITFSTASMTVAFKLSWQYSITFRARSLNSWVLFRACGGAPDRRGEYHLKIAPGDHLKTWKTWINLLEII
jgi:hypothetical protein